MPDLTTTIGCLNAVTLDTGGLDQAESVVAEELQSGAVTQAQNDAVVAFINNEDVAGPGSFALAEGNLEKLKSLWNTGS